MRLVEMTVKEARELCGENAKVLVAVQDLSKQDESILFEQKKREEYDKIFEDVKTVVSSMDDLVRRLDCFTEKQDLRGIKPVGVQKIVLVK